MKDGAVLLTGGTGYLGRWILHALRARGRAVRLLARNPDAAADLGAEGVTIVRGDVTDRASLEEAARGAAAVIHAAATVSSWEKDRGTFDRVNVGGLRAAVRAAEAGGAERFLYVSSFFALGPTDGITGDETLPVDPARGFHNDYERTKTLAEAEARELVERGHPLVTVYPGVLFGPGLLRESNFVSGMILDAAAGKLPGLPGGGDRRWCFTFVEDAGEGVVRALEKGEVGDRFVLGGENATLRAFFDGVEELGGPPVARKSLPFAALKAVGAVGELVAGLGGPRPRVTRGAAAIFEHEWAYSSRRAERALGWKARPLRDGIAATLAAIRATGRLA